MHLNKAILAMVCAAGLCVQAVGQRGAMVRSRNWNELTAQASTIVVGRVASARVEPHPQFKNLQTVVVTLKVSETWKGKAGDTLTFRQFIWDIRDIYAGASYRKGEEVLMLLNPVNEYGLTSPAGLEQGRFAVTYDASGKRYATNGRGNMGLFNHVGQPSLRPQASAVAKHPGEGPVALDELRSLFAAGGKK